MSQDNTSKRIDEILSQFSNSQSKDVYKAKDWNEAIKLTEARFEQTKSLIMEIISERESALLSRVKDSLPSQSKYKTPDSYKKAVRTKLDQLRKERI